MEKAWFAVFLALGMASCLQAEQVRVRPGGATELLDARVRFSATAFYPGWVSREAKGGFRPEKDGSRVWKIPAKDYEDTARPTFSGKTAWRVGADDSLDVGYSFKALRDVKLLCLAVVGQLPNEEYAGGVMCADGREVAIPATFEKVGVFRESVTNLVFRDAKGTRRFALELPRPTVVLLQDNRSWKGKNFSLRLLAEPTTVDIPVDYAKTLDFKVRSEGPVTCETTACVVTAGKDWIPMEEAFDVIPGSALDFTDIAGTGRPAGKYGRPVVRNGHFEFENLPGKPQRFYGVNFVAAANYPEIEYAKPFAATLAKLGYNAVRMHHHDGGIAGGRDGALDEKTMAKFDAFIAALIENGLYVTTDFYVSRKPPYRDCGIDRDGKFTDISTFKRVAMFHEGTFQNYIRHARALLSHVNPHTGRRYADEPALGWISLVNEGTLGAGGFDWLRECRAEVLAKWTAWLTAKKATDPAYAAIPATIPEKPRDLWTGDAMHKNAFLLFLADVERTFARRVTRVVRDELGCKALLTNMNYGFKCPAYQKLIVDEYDYMDDHFYVDHPHFLETKWRLPSQLENGNTFQRATCGAMYPVTRRIFGKPFVITEYNYSGPGQYRGVGGIATGAMAALQDWDGLWRFAWSHGDAGVKGPKAMTYFDMSGDPLGLASERASMCLFLRRDVASYDKAVAYHIDRGTADSLSVYQKEIPPDWRPVGWWAKVGCSVGDREPAGVQVVGRAAKGDRVDVLPKCPSGLPRPISVDSSAGSFRIETPRTAGGFAEGGVIVAGPVAAKLDGVATVWASSLDARPIVSSRRLLVTHLTDVQNSGITYADSSKRILLDWGKLPHLMRAGSAKLSIAVAEGRWTVYSLSPTGKRRAEIPSVYRKGRLRFTADVARDPACATYLYEVVNGAEEAKAPVAEEDLYAAFLTARPSQRVEWMKDGERRTNMAFKVGTPPKTRVKDMPPRWCEAEGVGNFRDLGGWTGLDGRKVRYGRIFRSAHFGHVKDPAAVVARYGIKTDLDLRKENEVSALNGKSPLGEGVRLLNLPSTAYAGFASDSGRKFFARFFRAFLDEANYPIAIHCAKGADRTGSVVMLLNGLLGVAPDDLVLDWELTAFYNPNPKFVDADRIDRLTKVIGDEKGETWTDKVVSYAKSGGVTDGEIARFRALMLEPSVSGEVRK